MLAQADGGIFAGKRLRSASVNLKSF